MSTPISIVKIPYIPPFSCGRCAAGEGTRDFFVDTGIQIEVVSHADGRLFICDACLTDIVNHVSIFYTKVDMDSVIETYSKVIEQSNEVKDHWESRVKEFNKIGINLEKVWDSLNGRSEPESAPVINPADVDKPKPIDPTGTDKYSDAGIDSTEPNSNALLAGFVFNSAE